MSAYAPIEVGCEAYIVRGGKLLLGIRKNSYGAGTWGMPGGRIEFQEFAQAGIIREIKEEVGATVEPDDVTLLAVTDDPQPQNEAHHLHLTFSVDIGQQTPVVAEPDSCEEWKWFPLDDLPENVFPPHRKILRTISTHQTYAAEGVTP